MSRVALLLLALALATGFFPMRVCHAESSEDAAVMPFGGHGPHDHHDGADGHDGHDGANCCVDTPVDVARPDAPASPAPPIGAAANAPPLPPAPLEAGGVSAPSACLPDLPRGVISIVLLR